LEGVEFKVFLGAQNSDPVASCAAVNPVIALATYVTEEDGIWKISGLRYSDWENGELIPDPDQGPSYWLVETRAPAGYELSAEPFEFYVTALTSGVSVSGTATDPDPTGVTDVPANAGFTLPYLGGSAIWWSVAGFVLAAVLALLLIRRRSAGQSPPANEPTDAPPAQPPHRE
jgi:hypothetical protein